MTEESLSGHQMWCVRASRTASTSASSHRSLVPTPVAMITTPPPQHPRVGAFSVLEPGVPGVTGPSSVWSAGGLRLKVCKHSQISQPHAAVSREGTLLLWSACQLRDGKSLRRQSVLRHHCATGGSYHTAYGMACSDTEPMLSYL